MDWDPNQVPLVDSACPQMRTRLRLALNAFKILERNEIWPYAFLKKVKNAVFSILFPARMLSWET
jgi:hypothetical protein